MKKMHYKSLVAAAILAGLSQQSALATDLTPLGSAQDTWVRIVPVDGKTNKFGNKDIMKVDRDFTGFVQFVIPALPDGEVIESVTLRLTSITAIPDAFISTITEPSVVWDESVVTEFDYPFVIDSKIDGTATANIPAATAVDFDITTAVTGAGTYTFNVDMEDTSSGNIKWVAGLYNSDDANRPTLLITTKSSGSADGTAPTFSEIPAIEINATGVNTDINALLNITANDDTDGPVNATVDGESSLPSGSHTVTLQATDVAGNKATKEGVIVNITPLIVLTAPVVDSIPSGTSTTASVALSGPAVTYPVTIDYSVDGEATSGDSGTLTFDEPTAQDIEITLLGDALDEQTAVLTLTAIDGVQATSETVTISAVEGNAAPSVSFKLTQDGATIATINAGNKNIIPYIDATKGSVTVTAEVFDFNGADEHSYAWTDSSDALGALGESFEFSPADLSGDFTLSVLVTETNTDPALFDELSAQVRIIATPLPELVALDDSDNDGIPDTEEGFKDSDGDGIVDYLDNVNVELTQLPLAGDQVLQTEDGLTLSLGSVSAAQGITAQSAVITLDDLANNAAEGDLDTTDTGYLPIDGVSLFNFTVSGLDDDATAAVVYPLPDGVVLGEDTEYRKYTPTRGWKRFDSDIDNSIASAEKDGAGNCPAPNDASYIDGLTAGDSCIQLTIKDGGVYDANPESGIIEDPGVLAEAFELLQWDTDTINLAAAAINEGSTVIDTVDLTTLVGSADVSTLTFAIESDSSWLSIDEAGVLSANLSGLATNDYTATISVSDDKAQTAQTEVKVPVVLNAAPKLAAVDLAPASRNEAYSASIAEQLSDIEGDTYTVEKVSGPYWLNVSEAGELTGTPRKADIGANNITVRLTDDKGATAETSFNVNVKKSDVKASSGGSFSAGLLALLGLISFGRRKLK